MHSLNDMPNTAAKDLQHGYVLSDLHMFAHRSTAADHLSAVREVAGGADFLVLNGDIFDFRWSTLAGADETAHVAVDWLASLVLGVNGCEVFYVLGNHDRFAFFADHLQGLTEQTDNFHWHASHVRLGRCLFLHGDLVFDRKCADAETWLESNGDPNTVHKPTGWIGVLLLIACLCVNVGL